jgi:hypothetical protein
MSAAARRKIAAAQRARWAKLRSSDIRLSSARKLCLVVGMAFRPHSLICLSQLLI